MSIRFSELFHPESTRGMNMTATSDPRTTPSGLSQDHGIAQSWLDDDSHSDLRNAEGHINWTMVSGVALSLAVSASFWAGVALVIERVSR